MKNKQLSFVLAFIFLITLMPSYSHAEGITDESISADSKVTLVTQCETSDELAEYLAGASDDEVIPVVIRIRDDVNLSEVDSLAMERAGVTEAQLESYEAQSYALSSTTEEIITQQTMIRETNDRIRKERIAILREHYQQLTNDFLVDARLTDAKCASVSKLLPWINGIELTKEQICQLVNSGQVSYMDYYEDTVGADLVSVDDTRKIIGGNVAINSGYTGSGVRVGLVESGHPDFVEMGTDSVNITKTNSGTTKPHATQTSGIIKKLAPECSIFSRTASGLLNTVTQCVELIEDYNVQVINISYGAGGDGSYNSVSRQMDEVVQIYKVPIVVAAGNDYSKGYVNQLGLGANVIAVGAVATSGTSPTASGAFTLAEYSSYRENIQTINKPDICAPGNVQIYSYEEAWGTSFAAPHVTGTIVQMLSRNSALADRPETIKAALMASAFYNAGTDLTYVPRTRVSNEEGAGVVNAHFCYNIASSGQFIRHGVSGPGTYSVTVSCNDISRPFRIATAWYVTSSEADGSTSRLNIDISVYKNGTLIASSTAPGGASSIQASTNYEIIQLEPSVIKTYGAGQYEVRISLSGSFSGMSPNYVGVVYGLRPTL